MLMLVPPQSFSSHVSLTNNSSNPVQLTSIKVGPNDIHVSHNPHLALKLRLHYVRTADKCYILNSRKKMSNVDAKTLKNGE